MVKRRVPPENVDSPGGPDDGVVVEVMPPDTDEDGQGPHAGEPLRRGIEKRPSLSDALGMRFEGDRRGSDILHEVYRGSVNASEYLMRTVFNGDEEIEDHLIINEELMLATLGYIDVPTIGWLRLHMRPSLKGHAREQVERMYIGRKQREEDMFTGMVRGGNPLRRAKTINNEEVMS